MKTKTKYRLFHRIDGMLYAGQIMAFMLLDGTWKIDDGKDVLIAQECGYIPMEYSGMKDVEGKEIFEGDLVKDKNGVIKQIWFKNGAFRRLNSKNSRAKNKNVLYSSKIFNLEIKVIGNVFENPEIKTKNKLK